MLGLRRYRVFLLVAALSAATIYWLSNRNSWDIADIERLGQSTFKHDRPQAPVVEAPSPEPPSDAVIRPADPPKDKITSRILDTTSTSESPAATEKAQTKTASTKSTFPTVTGEELLTNEDAFEDDFGEEGSGRQEAGPVLQDSRRSRWRKPPAHYPVAKEDLIKMPSSSAKSMPKIQATFGTETRSSRNDRISKLNTIKESFKHAWQGYKQYGMPHDEVQPISKGNKDPFMGWGATLVDTLDTLWIMGLNQEFEEALVEVEKIDFETSVRKDIPLFETVIRYLGGLLSAHDITKGKYPMLLQKAENLTDILMGAFDTPNRMPITFYNWAPSYTSQSHRASSHAVMAEIGSLSVEMTRLAQITGKHEYYDAIARITDELERWQPNTLIPGLWPLKLDASGCQKAELDPNVDDEATGKPVLVNSKVSDLDGTEPADYSGTRGKPSSNIVPRDAAGEPAEENADKRTPPMQKVDQEILAVDCTPQGLSAEPNAKMQTFGIGGQADSTYEYFPKMHALLRGRTQQYKNLYLESARAIRENLLFRPMIKDTKREILFTSKHDMNPKAREAWKKDANIYEVTHLGCFAGGMFGLGAKLFGIEGDLEIAQQLTDGCVWAYESMPTGVMAESATVVPCPDMDVCAWDEAAWHKALDPQLEERFAAVEKWNRNQKEIYEKSREQAEREDSIPSKAAPESKATSAESKGETRPAKRDVEDAETPSRTLPKNSVEEEDDDDDDVSSASSSPISFVPKVALSHAKFVKARIQEERLPPSYTKIFARHYGLRPEAIESVFYMYRITGDKVWQEKGWKMFEAIQAATQTDIANAAMRDVTSNLGELDDVMESFWLAETLKYFYLLFDEPENYSLDKWVFNTEAHPLAVSG